MLKFIQMLLALMACPVMAQSQWSVGTGYQYGGLIGLKYTHPLSEKNKVHIALSPGFGAAVGYQRYWDSNRRHAWGVAAGFEAVLSEDGFLVATYNYYPKGFWEPGWTLGIDAGVRDAGEDCYFKSCSTRTVYPALFINLGYQF